MDLTDLDSLLEADARILIVDDQADNVVLLRRMLEATYSSIRGITRGVDVAATVAEFRPDIVLLDLNMPDVSGFEVLAQLRESTDSRDYVPIIVLTADFTADARRRALELGADGFVTKPLDRAEVVLHVRNALRGRGLQLSGRRP